MDWGSTVTYIGSTVLKEKNVQFGIKDADRSMHVSILGRTGSGRGDMLVSMALQDIERGVGVLFLDATGSSSKKLLERIDPAFLDRVVFVDPSDAEYPYSWNIMDDIRALPEALRFDACVDVLTDLYAISRTPFVEEVARLVLEKPGTSMLTLYLLATDEKFRTTFFNDEAIQKAFEEKLAVEQTLTDALREYGKYVARDTLVRNVIGQKVSKFTLSALAEGKIVVVDFSRIKLFPTRMTPLVRLFLHGARFATVGGGRVATLYIHDCIRYVSEAFIELLFAPHAPLALTVADTLIQEGDMDRRLFALSRSGTVASFAAHPGDKPLIERAFYPFAEVDELVKLEPREYIIALTIDGVRARPFYALALPLPERKHVSYQDIVVRSRQEYTMLRTAIDAELKMKRDDKEGGPPNSPKGFQDAFRSIFAKQAEKAKQATDGTTPAAPTPNASPAPAGGVAPAPSAGSTAPAAPPAGEKRELPEDMLRQMLYVAPVSVFFLIVGFFPLPLRAGMIDHFSIITSPHTVQPQETSPVLTVEAQDSSGAAVNGNTVCLEITSSALSGEFSSNGTTWGEPAYRTLALTLSSNQYRRNFYYRDPEQGVRTITVYAAPRPPDSTCPEVAVQEGVTWTTSQQLVVNATATVVPPQTTDTPTSNTDTVTTETSGATGSNFIESPIRAYAGTDRTVFVGADSVFEGYAEGLSGEPLQNARYLWSFGNGDIRDGQAVSYHFPFPGTYVVVLEVANGLYSASDRLTVRAIPAEVVITHVTSEYIALKNGSASEINLEGWMLFAAGAQFQFPQNTILAPNQEVFISNKRTGLSGSAPDTVVLQYPNGTVATRFEYPLFIAPSVSVDTPLPSRAVSSREKNTDEEGVGLSGGAPENVELITAPAVALSGTVSPSWWGWVLALLALSGIAGVGLVLLKKNTYQEYSIKEMP